MVVAIVYGQVVNVLADHYTSLKTILTASAKHTLITINNPIVRAGRLLPRPSYRVGI